RCNPAGRKRVWLRPAFLASRIRLHRGGIGPGRKKSGQPPGQGAGAATGPTAWNRSAIMNPEEEVSRPGRRAQAAGNTGETSNAPRVRPASGHGLGHRRLPPLSLYVYVPWCVRKCPYCDFNSHEAQDSVPEEAYLKALQADLEQALPLIWGRQVISIFIGGGTPSLLSAQAIDSMLASFRACLNLLPDAEITLEANPGTAEAGRFRDYAASGVNRLSLGVQSFNDEALRALGRIHDAKQARAAIDMALSAVDRVNLDLMY